MIVRTDASVVGGVVVSAAPVQLVDAQLLLVVACPAAVAGAAVPAAAVPGTTASAIAAAVASSQPRRRPAHVRVRVINSPLALPATRGHRRTPRSRAARPVSLCRNRNG